MAYTANIIPEMTSATEPSGVVSGTYSSSYEPWKAFDSDHNGTFYANGCCGGLPDLTYQFPTGKTVTKVMIRPYQNNFSDPNAGLYMPQDLHILGSNNGSDWTELYTEEVNYTGNTNLEFNYEFANTTAYTYYKIHSDTRSPIGAWAAYANIEMYETAPTPKFFAIKGDMTYTSQYPTQDIDHVKATSTFGAGQYQPYFATDPTKSLTSIDGSGSVAWLTMEAGSQRFHIDLGEAKIIKRIYFEAIVNLLHSTWYGGVGDFTFWGSNDGTAFTTLTYATDTNWTQLTTDPTIFQKHSETAQSEPQYALVTNTTAYRYYALKIANYGDSSYYGIRRIELQTKD